MNDDDEKRGFALGLEQAARSVESMPTAPSVYFDQTASRIRVLQPDPSLVVVRREELEKVRAWFYYEDDAMGPNAAGSPDRMRALLDAMLKETP